MACHETSYVTAEQALITIPSVDTRTDNPNRHQHSTHHDLIHFENRQDLAPQANARIQWTEQLLRDEDITPPTNNKLFVGATATLDINPQHRKAASLSMIANQLAHKHVEPSHQPCTDEIPLSDLAFWLGNATGQVECECASCAYQRSRGRVALVGPEHHAHKQTYIPVKLHKNLSSKIALISVPRIEGIN